MGGGHAMTPLLDGMLAMAILWIILWTWLLLP